MNMSKLQRMTIVLVLLLFGLQPLDGGGRIGTQAAHAAPETDARVAGREPSQSTSSASTYVPEALGGTASTGGLIIDDLDPWTVWPCLIAPCPGTGFSLGGPTGGWQESSGSTANMYDGHAYFTYAAALSEWGGEETNNWAQWVLEEPLIGVYHVDAFIPHVSTGRDDTQSAQYRIYHAGGVSVVAVDQTRNPGWVRLGTFEFDDAIQSLPRVTLRDATPDYSSGGQRKTVLFDAIRWTEGDVAEPPSSGATADSYLRNASRSMILPDGTRFDFGESLYICYRVSPAGLQIRHTLCAPDGCKTVGEGIDNGVGKCAPVTTSQPAGERTVTIEAFRSGQLVASDRSTYWVGPSSPPCTDNASLVTGNRVTVTSGDRFDVAPVIINAGTCPWTSANGYYLAFVDGDRLGAASRIDLASGQTYPPGMGQNFVMHMTAPEEDGRFVSRWQMRRDTGSFGPVFDVIVDVEAAPPPPPSPMRANPAPLATKEAIISHLEDPPVSIMDLRLPRNVLPANIWGYDESTIKSWLPRFRGTSYTTRELSGLVRAVSAEQAVKSYHGQVGELSFASADYFSDWFFSLAGTLKAASQLVTRLAKDIAPGLAKKATHELAVAIADMVNDLGGVAVDKVVKEAWLATVIKGAIRGIVSASDKAGLQEVVKESVRLTGAGIASGGITQRFADQTQGVIEDIAGAARQGPLAGDDHSAEVAVSNRVTAAERSTDGVKRDAAKAASAAEFSRFVGDAADIVAIAAAPAAPPLSAFSKVVSLAGRIGDFAGSMLAAYLPFKRIGVLRNELGATTDRAFSGALAGVQSASPMGGETRSLILAVPRTRRVAADLDESLNRLDQALIALIAALQAGNVVSVERAAGQLDAADLTFQSDMRVALAAPSVGMAEVAEGSTLDTRVGEVVDGLLPYHGARLTTYAALLQFAADRSPAMREGAQAAAESWRSAARAHRDRVIAAADAASTVPMGPALAVRSVTWSPTEAMPGGTLTLDVRVANSGGIGAPNATIRVDASEGLVTQKAETSVAVPAGEDGRAVLAIVLSPQLERGSNANIVIVVTDRADGRSIFHSVPVPIAPLASGSGMTIYLPSTER